jgi:catechol 2,3-dioxygenase-like lactoylglutathione lyase family enzyme
MEAVMLKRIAVVGVPASDVARAVQFYRDTLGLRRLPQHAGPPHFQVGDAFLAVFERSESTAKSGTPLVAFGVDDLDAVMSALTERGVLFEGGVHQDGDARWTAFHDSEGNLLELVQFPR